MERTVPPSRRNIQTRSNQLERTISSRRSGTNKARPTSRRTRLGATFRAWFFLVLSSAISKSNDQTSTRLNALQTPSSRGTTGAGSVPGSRQVLLRRVQAVVEVPVKEESVDRGAPESGMAPSASTFPPSISSSKPTSAPTQSAKPNQATTRIKRKAVAKRRYVEVDDSDTTGEGFGSEPSEHDYPYVTSDDDDELMMGAEVRSCVSPLYWLTSFLGQPQRSLRYKTYTKTTFDEKTESANGDKDAQGRFFPNGTEKSTSRCHSVSKIVIVIVRIDWGWSFNSAMYFDTYVIHYVRGFPCEYFTLQAYTII